MKYILGLSFLLSQLVYGQSDLDFSKLYIDAVDKWIAFEKEEDNSYGFGFVYLDTSAGLTIDSKGSFKVSEEGVFINQHIFDKTSLKARIQKSNRKIAILSNSRLKELGLKVIPDWLKIYKGDANSERSLYAYGYLYNDWNVCDKAVPYLEKGLEKYPENKGVLTELIFSYNCLQQFSKAEDLLVRVSKKHPKDDYINKEIIYTFTKSNKIKKASKSIKKSLKEIPNSRFHGENIHNLLYAYYSKRDSKNFKKWLPKGKKYAKNQKQFLNNIKIMKKELKL